jgi:hypothetical protein
MAEDQAIGNGGSISQQTDKIDQTVPDGLIGTPGSLAYTVNKINKHFHNHERWLVKAVVPVGETHVADPMSVGSTPFQVNGGNDTWGAWTQLVGTNDTPIDAGELKFDFHRILITAYERNDTIYKIQFGIGDTGAAALASGNYTEFPIITQVGINNIEPMEFMSEGVDVGSKVWVRVWAVGQVSGTLDFYVGIHEYVG